MITINIIPDKIKKEIKINFIYSLLKQNLYILIIILSVFGIILLISENILISTLTKEMNGSSLDFKNATNSSQNKVNDINNNLLLLNNIQEDFIRWSVFFDYLSKNIPKNITLSKLNITNDGSEISFSGNAPTREALLSFKEMLEDSKTFIDVNFPIQNLLQKENISFEIKAKLELNEITLRYCCSHRYAHDRDCHHVITHDLRGAQCYCLLK